MPYLELETFKLHYVEHGDGKPVLFLHGLGADHTQAIAYLKGVNPVKKITPDFPGHGKTSSKANAKEIDMQALVDAIKSLLDHLGHEKCYLGGISLGAATSLRLAIQYPDVLSGLILVRPAWLNQPYPPNFSDILEIARLIEEYGIDKGKEIFLASERFIILEKEIPGYAHSLKAQFERQAAKETLKLLRKLPSESPFSDWEELSVVFTPTLILSNAKDPLHPLDYGIQLAKEMPNAQFFQVPPRYIQPEYHISVCQEYMQEFLNG